MPRLDPEEVRLDTIRPKPGSRTNRKRVGRGEGDGHGKTSGRGHGGAGSRAGSKRKAGYEGGQTPIHMRMRKLRGPHRKMSMPFERFRTHTEPVNIGDLPDRFEDGATVDRAGLVRAGLAHGKHPIKVLAKGELDKKLNVSADKFSAAAVAAIEAAGGSVTYVGADVDENGAQDG